jgi:hypothetical protein
MALDASQRGMRTGQRKLGLVMIERRRAPAVGAVADGAVLAEIVLHVVGIGDVIVIVLVA